MTTNLPPMHIRCHTDDQYASVLRSRDRARGRRCGDAQAIMLADLASSIQRTEGFVNAVVIGVHSGASVACMTAFLDQSRAKILAVGALATTAAQELCQRKSVRLVREGAHAVSATVREGALDLLHTTCEDDEAATLQMVHDWHLRVRPGGFWLMDGARRPASAAPQEELARRGFREIERMSEDGGEWVLYQRGLFAQTH